jgi:LysM domain
MELVQRMTIATSRLRSLVVLGASAALTLFVGFQSSVTAAEADRTIATGTGIPLAADAPDRYTVKRGDTLWDISKVFLRDPWYWPEIWYINPQVANPHRIYPGDVLMLTSVNGQPRVTLAERGAEGASGTTHLSPQVRSEPIDQAITAIPYEFVRAFAGRPTLLDKEAVERAPYVVGMRDRHLIAGAGNEIYASGLDGAAVDSRYSVIHIDRPLRDPETNRLLGYSGIYAGTGQVAATGELPKLVITDSARESLQGDKLFPESTVPPADYFPKAPKGQISGSIIAVQGVSLNGTYQVVAVNRGKSSGLEPGDVLAVYELGDVIKDRYARGGLGSGMTSAFGGGKKVKLPDERNGIVLVFETFDDLSFALVMETLHPIREGDSVANP